MGFRLVLLKLVNANRRTVCIVVINSKETNEKVRKKNLFWLTFWLKRMRLTKTIQFILLIIKAKFIYTFIPKIETNLLH